MRAKHTKGNFIFEITLIKDDSIATWAVAHFEFFLFFCHMCKILREAFCNQPNVTPSGWQRRPLLRFLVSLRLIVLWALLVFRRLICLVPLSFLLRSLVLVKRFLCHIVVYN